jgi:hypothetical protein
MKKATFRSKGQQQHRYPVIFNRKISYVKATSRTMAISHVWSHGHGGRPSTGMNTCLDEEFSELAKANGCDSYWIDAVCIPQDHNLRKETIGYINQIFIGSKMVLILDRDLVQIEAERLSVDTAESILTTFLVCDWGVRAWTMLEAIKGRQRLHILCKNQKMWSLQNILRTIHTQGRIDLAILTLGLPVLFSTERMHSGEVSSVEAGANILSNRHATRARDEIIIWSLLCGGDVYDDAVKFWRAQIGRTLRAAFLLSSAPRIQGTPGLSWAPSTPYIRQYDANQVKVDHIISRGDEGEGMEAEILNEGLEAEWLAYFFKDTHSTVYESVQVIENGNQQQILNPCWTRARHLSGSFANVVLIQPRLLVDRTFIAQGEFHGEAFAICTSQDGKIWQWDSVQKWPMAVSLPPLQESKLLIG